MLKYAQLCSVDSLWLTALLESIVLEYSKWNIVKLKLNILHTVPASYMLFDI